MSCEELRPDYLLYAMGTMAEPEIGEMREHLARGCQACTEGLRQAHAMAYSMGAVLEGRDAPRELRKRVLAIADAEPAGARRLASSRQSPFWARPVAVWQGWALAAACLLLALAPGLFLYRQVAESHARQAESAALLEREERSAAALRQQVAKLEGDTVPQAAPIFVVEMERGAASSEVVKELAIPKGAAAVVLALPEDLARQASTAEVRDGSLQKIWSVSPLPGGDADSTGLTVPTRLLPAGRYTLELLAGDRSVARVALQVVRR